MTVTQQDSVKRRHIAVIVFVVGITLITGAVHGHFMQRWGSAPDLLAAARHLESFPKQFGDWQFLSEEPMDESTVRMLSCAGYVNRQYVNRKTGRTVSVAIMVGPSGPISVHTPEVCYSSRAYTIQEPRREISLPDSDERSHKFWSLAFHSNTPSTDMLRVCYAWYGKNGWEASKSPRFEFAGRPLLFKLQIAAMAPPAKGEQAQATHDACEEFLTVMLRSGWSING